MFAVLEVIFGDSYSPCLVEEAWVESGVFKIHWVSGA